MLTILNDTNVFKPPKYVEKHTYITKQSGHPDIEPSTINQRDH